MSERPRTGRVARDGPLGTSLLEPKPGLGFSPVAHLSQRREPTDDFESRGAVDRKAFGRPTTLRNLVPGEGKKIPGDWARGRRQPPVGDPKSRTIRHRRCCLPEPTLGSGFPGTRTSFARPVVGFDRSFGSRSCFSGTHRSPRVPRGIFYLLRFFGLWGLFDPAVFCLYPWRRCWSRPGSSVYPSRSGTDTTGAATGRRLDSLGGLPHRSGTHSSPAATGVGHPGWGVGIFWCAQPPPVVRADRSVHVWCRPSEPLGSAGPGGTGSGPIGTLIKPFSATP